MSRSTVEQDSTKSGGAMQFPVVPPGRHAKQEWGRGSRGGPRPPCRAGTGTESRPPRGPLVLGLGGHRTEKGRASARDETALAGRNAENPRDGFPPRGAFLVFGGAKLFDYPPPLG